MIDPLRIATDGMLADCNKTLTIATSGFIYQCETTVIEIPVKKSSGGSSKYTALTRKELEYQKQLKERIAREEKEILIIIRAFLTTI